MGVCLQKFWAALNMHITRDWRRNLTGGLADAPVHYCVRPNGVYLSPMEERVTMGQTWGRGSSLLMKVNRKRTDNDKDSSPMIVKAVRKTVRWCEAPAAKVCSLVFFILCVRMFVKGENKMQLSSTAKPSDLQPGFVCSVFKCLTTCGMLLPHRCFPTDSLQIIKSVIFEWWFSWVCLITRVHVHSYVRNALKVYSTLMCMTLEARAYECARNSSEQEV